MTLTEEPTTAVKTDFRRVFVAPGRPRQPGSSQATLRQLIGGKWITCPNDDTRKPVLTRRLLQRNIV